MIFNIYIPMPKSFLKTTLAIIAAAFYGCKPELKELSFDANGMDMSRYVALGGMHTSGMADGALYTSAQENSYPAILAQQFKLVGGTDFRQPLVQSETGVGYDYTHANFNSKYILKNYTLCNAEKALLPVLYSTGADESILGLQPVPPFSVVVTNTIGSPSVHFNNMAVPGMRAFQADQTTFGDKNILISQNPFYARFASAPGLSTVLQDAASQNPSFFTLWPGVDDMLIYAMIGADEMLDSITTSSYLDASVKNTVSKLIATTPNGVIANVPDFFDMPYFTTIPWNGLRLTQEEADALNASYAGALHFEAGINPFVVKDGATTRLALPTDYILLSVPQDSILCAGWGSAQLKPLADKYVITNAEATLLKNAVKSYNAALLKIATENNLAFADMNAFLKSFHVPSVFNGVAFSSDFISGQFFSLDGITFTPRGNALCANEIIKVINTKYNCTIPMADVNKYHGIVFP